jgi:hypothetical protein
MRGAELTLRPNYRRRVQAFVARFHLELHGLTFSKGFEPVHLNRREVYEYVVSTLLFNEAVTLRVIEPLHLSLDHPHRLLQ